jgi:hypothetical protein
VVIKPVVAEVLPLPTHSDTVKQLPCPFSPYFEAVWGCLNLDHKIDAIVLFLDSAFKSEKENVLHARALVASAFQSFQYSFDVNTFAVQLAHSDITSLELLNASSDIADDGG